MYGIVGENTRRPFRPFHEAKMIAVQTVFHTRLDRFLLVLQAIQVNMKYFTRGGIAERIFVDDGKGWTADCILNSFYVAKRVNKCSFPRTHITMKGKYRGITTVFPKHGCSFFDIVQCKPELHAQIYENSNPVANIPFVNREQASTIG
jgi:hypothetical protein